MIEQPKVEIKPKIEPKPTAVPSIPMVTAPVPKPAAKSMPKKNSPKSKKAAKVESSSSDEDKPNKLVMQTRWDDSDSGDDLFESLSKKNMDDDDPFNPLGGVDGDFEKILKPIKPYPNPSNAPAKTTSQPAPAEKPKKVTSIIYDNARLVPKNLLLMKHQKRERPERRDTQRERKKKRHPLKQIINLMDSFKE